MIQFCIYFNQTEFIIIFEKVLPVHADHQDFLVLVQTRRPEIIVFPNQQLQLRPSTKIQVRHYQNHDLKLKKKYKLIIEKQMSNGNILPMYFEISRKFSQHKSEIDKTRGNYFSKSTIAVAPLNKNVGSLFPESRLKKRSGLSKALNNMQSTKKV